MRTLTALCFMTLTVLAVPHAQAAELPATIASVVGKEVQLKLEGELLPAVGDKVEIYEILPDIELEATVARGQVEAVRDGRIHVKITSSSSQIRTNHRARVNSPNPRRITSDQPLYKPRRRSVSGSDGNTTPNSNRALRRADLELAKAASVALLSVHPNYVTREQLAALAEGLTYGKLVESLPASTQAKWVGPTDEMRGQGALVALEFTSDFPGQGPVRIRITFGKHTTTQAIGPIHGVLIGVPAEPTDDRDLLSWTLLGAYDEGLPEDERLHLFDLAEAEAHEAAALNNLKYIGLAMHNYHEKYKSFPAAYSTDNDGRPLLSWRVHILPFLDAQALYEEFHLDEPWDSPHNHTLIEKMPDVFESPGSKHTRDGLTNYLTVRGEKTVFPGSKGISFKDITDGTSNTLMTVEVVDEKAVIWTRPQDMKLDVIAPLNDLVGLRKDRFLAGSADGAVTKVPAGIDRDQLRLWFTRDDGTILFDKSSEWYNKGLELEKQDRLDEAIEAVRVALSLAPANDFYWDMLGDVYAKKKAWSQAEDAYRKATQLKPNWVFHHSDLGDALYRQQKYEEAAAVYREAIRLAPDLTVFHATLATALLKQGKRDEAISAAKEAKRLGLRDHWVYGELGLEDQ